MIAYKTNDKFSPNRYRCHAFKFNPVFCFINSISLSYFAAAFDY